MQRPPNQAFALLADADANVRETLSAAVSLVGLASTPVEDGRQAIEMLADLRPSMVILDVQLPGLSGVEVCWWIRRQWHLADVPVILLSGLTSQFEIDAGLLAGANHYVTKPFKSSHITALVARHLVGGPLAAPGPCDHL
ncbi:response regulator [Pedococcus sp. P5_B7]